MVLGRLTSSAADHRKRGHSRPGFLSAPKNPRGGGLFLPPSSIRRPRWLRHNRPVSVPEAVRAGRNKEGQERLNYGVKLAVNRPRSHTKKHAQDPGNERLTPKFAILPVLQPSASSAWLLSSGIPSELRVEFGFRHPGHIVAEHRHRFLLGALDLHSAAAGHAWKLRV